MAGARKRQRSKHDAARARTPDDGSGAASFLAGDVPFAKNGHEAAGVVVYVLGGGGAGVDRNPAQRDFPLVKRRKGESEAAHLARVVHQVDEAMAAGGTHLLVPREQADWLGDHPRVAEYLAEHHDLVEASAETGLVFTLRPPGPVALQDRGRWVGDRPRRRDRAHGQTDAGRADGHAAPDRLQRVGC